MAKQVKRWVIEDHICRGCGGRILQCVAGAGPTGGGNPIFRCADCGQQTAATGPDALCWCGYEARHVNGPSPYACVNVAAAKDNPALKAAMARCGCFVDGHLRSEIGIVLLDDLRRVEVDNATPPDATPG